MQLNVIAIILATAAQFAIGAIWYSLFFGKLWGKIHGFDKLPKQVQQKMMKSMGPFYGIQLFVTLLTTIILEVFIVTLSSSWNSYSLAFLLWIGFIVPAQVSAVIFGGTEKKWIVKKIAVQAGASVFCLETAAAILHFFA